MCLILVAYRIHPAFDLILAANRDEYYERPSAPPRFWDEAPHVLAGRDLVAGGTWLGVTRTGKLGAVTNYRDPTSVKENAISRGRLVSDFLIGQVGPSDYLKRVKGNGDLHNGFNMLAGNRDSLFWYSNRDGRILRLRPGLYGLSNHLLDTPWPKVMRGKALMTEIIKGIADPSPEDLFELLRDRRVPPDVELPFTGVDRDWERVLSPIFIQSAVYGTRSSTLVFISSKGRLRFIDRTFNSTPEHAVGREFEFSIRTCRGA